MGVWIETLTDKTKRQSQLVTPCVGVWIETTLWVSTDPCISSHPAWVCGLKHKKDKEVTKWLLSHPAWVCGLKLRIKLCVIIISGSHPAWVCGLKQANRSKGLSSLCHTLRGCVD